MGTFAATLSLGATVSSGWTQAGDVSLPKTVYETLVADDSFWRRTSEGFEPPGTHTLTYRPDHANISLDSGAPIHFASLPSGFIVDSLFVTTHANQAFMGDLSSSVVIKHDGAPKQTYNLVAWAGVVNTLAFGPTEVVTGRLLKAFFGVIDVELNCGVDYAFVVDDVGITGTYHLWSTSITFNVSIGCPGVIVSVQDGQGGMDLLGSFFFTYESGGTFVTLPATVIYNSGAQVQLVVPFGIPVGLCSVSAYLVDSPFAEVVLGTFTIPGGCSIYGPASAPEECGTRVTIVGESFSLEEVYVIKFGETSVLATVLDENTLLAFSPDHAPGVVDLTLISVQADTETVVGSFTFTSTTPSITSIDPAIGTLAGGTPVDINGVNFVAGSSILFDGVPATSVVFVNSTKYTAVTPSHQVGAVTVQVIAP